MKELLIVLTICLILISLVYYVNKASSTCAEQGGVVIDMFVDDIITTVNGITQTTPLYFLKLRNSDGDTCNTIVSSREFYARKVGDRLDALLPIN